MSEERIPLDEDGRLKHVKRNWWCVDKETVCSLYCCTGRHERLYRVVPPQHKHKWEITYYDNLDTVGPFRCRDCHVEGTIVEK